MLALQTNVQDPRIIVRVENIQVPKVRTPAGRDNGNT